MAVFVGCFWNLLVALVAIALFVAYSRNLAGAARSRQILYASIAVMIGGTPLSGLLGAAAHRYMEPRDDWYDIAGFGSFVTGCVSTPIFGLILLCAFYETQRNSVVRFGQRHCTCGYDLTGNQSGRCPECGTAVAPTQSQNDVDRGENRL